MVKFFWMPKEFLGWIRELVSSNDFWLVTWPVGRDAYISEASSLDETLFSDCREDCLHLFVGSKSLNEPVWRQGTGARREIDFAESYGIQIVPSVFAGEDQILIEGRVGILKLANYSDARRAEGLANLRKSIVASLRKHSDKKHVVVQRFPSGGQKLWSNILLGKSVASTKNLKLKQFATGPVEFEIISRVPLREASSDDYGKK